MREKWSSPHKRIGSSWKDDRVGSALPKMDANGKPVKKRKLKLTTTWRR